MTIRRRTASEYRLIPTRESPNVLLPARLLAIGGGYAMVRRKGETAYPFCVEEQKWLDADIVGRKE